MKRALVLKGSVIAFCFFIITPVLGQVAFKGVKEKYTFQVDTTYWIMAGPQKVARKLKYDKASKGVEPKYEYIFCKNDHEIVDEPFFGTLIIPMSSNTYEELKTSFGKMTKVKLAKVDSMIGYHGQKRTEVIADNEKKAIAYTVYNPKEAESDYTYNVIFCRDKYILMYVFGSKKEDLTEAYEKFTKAVLSTKF